MNIVWICSEAVPFAKTGGLADVSGALPTALSELGHNVSVIMPYYPRVMGDLCAHTSVRYKILEVPFGASTERATIREKSIKDGPTFYFIEYNRFYDRPFLYDYYGEEYGDNAERFIFLCRAAMETIKALRLAPDILHTNDWHAALCPVYLKSALYANNPEFANTKSVLTIHNIGYQGVFHKEFLPLTGLGWEHFNHTCLEFHDQLNFLQGGVMTADMVTTVSPTYAREILSPDYAFNLDGALNHVAYQGKLRGILNGIDTKVWNPATDKLIPRNYSINDMEGKKECKRELRRRLNLEEAPGKPVVGVVSRLAYQKGIDILLGAMWTLLREEDAQFAVLGSGDPDLEAELSRLCEHFPGQIGVHIGYDNALAHLIEAGSDFFAMPSRYEPCGLNQMYSMLYGTPPIVRATGGLEDTVVNYSPDSLERSNGFKFLWLNNQALIDTIRWAISIRKETPKRFKRLQRNGMASDFSWRRTADLYSELYAETRLDE